MGLTKHYYKGYKEGPLKGDPSSYSPRSPPMYDFILKRSRAAASTRRCLAAAAGSPVELDLGMSGLLTLNALKSESLLPLTGCWIPGLRLLAAAVASRVKRGTVLTEQRELQSRKQEMVLG